MLVSRVENAFSSIFKTARYKHGGDWARKCRILPPENAEPGPFNPDRTPYTEAIYEASENPKYERIAWVCGTQQSKTETLFNIAGKRYDTKPVPTTFVYPTRETTQEISQDRFQKMIDNSTLRDKLLRGKHNTMKQKFISGVRCSFAWATSAPQLASKPAGLVFVDERDHMVDNVQKEGDPVTLIAARGGTYANFKIIITSTPTLEKSSQIWKLFLSGTQQRWYIPCLSCGDLFLPEFHLLRWEYEIIEKSITATDAWVECPNCKERVESDDRDEMNQKGGYCGIGQKVEGKKITGKLRNNRMASFWVSGLCSPWRSYIKLADEWLKAWYAKDVEEMQGVLNTQAGEVWKTEGDVPELEEVRALRSGLSRNIVPDDTQMITACVDVGKRDFHFTIRAWGYDGETWLIDQDVILVDTLQLESWKILERVIVHRKYRVSKTEYFPIVRIFIDSRYRSELVFQFCMKFPGVAIPTKALKDVASRYRLSKVEFDLNGRKVPGGIMCFFYGDGYYKGVFHQRIKRGPINGPQTYHITKDADDNFLQQIINEQFVETSTKGGSSSNSGGYWDYLGPNHYLDCEKQQEAICSYLDLVNLSKVDYNQEDPNTFRVLKESLIK